MPGGNPSRKPSEITWTNFDIQARVSFAQNWSEKTQLLLPWQETCVTVGEGRRLKLAFFFLSWDPSFLRIKSTAKQDVGICFDSKEVIIAVAQ